MEGIGRPLRAARSTVLRFVFERHNEVLDRFRITLRAQLLTQLLLIDTAQLFAVLCHISLYVP